MASTWSRFSLASGSKMCKTKRCRRQAGNIFPEPGTSESLGPGISSQGNILASCTDKVQVRQRLKNGTYDARPEFELSLKRGLFVSLFLVRNIYQDSSLVHHIILWSACPFHGEITRIPESTSPDRVLGRAQLSLALDRFGD